MSILIRMQALLDRSRAFDFLGPAAIRLFLAPIFILAGMNKLGHVENVAMWFDSLASRHLSSWPGWPD
jgi:uncharacterized membrane protein YphA (DoxX/SURF4 family)